MDLPGLDLPDPLRLRLVIEPLLAASRQVGMDPRTIAADAALLLLVGGLVMLTVIMSLVAVQNIVPERSPAPGSVGAGSARNEPLCRLWPRRPQQVPSGLPVDKAMARIVHLRLGEPRILQARLHTTRVRLYGCPGCAAEAAPAGGAAPGCGGERTGVEHAFRDIYGGRVVAWEIACRRRGDEACDFEVRH